MKTTYVEHRLTVSSPVGICTAILTVLVLSGCVAATAEGQPGDDQLVASESQAARSDILALMKRVADYQLENPGTEKDWIHGAMWTGIMATYQLTHDAKYLNAIRTWAGAGWTLAKGAGQRADNQCAAQTYFDAYLLDPSAANPAMLNGAKPSFDRLVSNPPKGRVEWWWEDALFMAPPGFTRLGAATGEPLAGDSTL